MRDIADANQSGMHAMPLPYSGSGSGQSFRIPSGGAGMPQGGQSHSSLPPPSRGAQSSFRFNSKMSASGVTIKPRRLRKRRIEPAQQRCRASREHSEPTPSSPVTTPTTDKPPRHKRTTPIPLNADFIRTGRGRSWASRQPPTAAMAAKMAVSAPKKGSGWRSAKRNASAMSASNRM